MNVPAPGAIAPPKTRSSNLELYRVIVMILIIAHHYVGNSGLITAVYEHTTSVKSLLLLMFSAFGKPGINCFLMITGYYMCTSNITFKKYMKLLLQVYFYKVVIAGIFWITGYQAFTLKSLLRMLAPMTSLGSNFTGCYLLFFLLIPFLNALIHSLSQRMHLLLIALCLLIYTVIGGLGGLPFFTLKMNYVSWFSVLYLIAAYIRLYPNTLSSKTGFWGWAALVSFICTLLSVVVCAWVGDKLGQPKLAFFFVSDSNKVLALAMGITSFMFFKNIKLPYSKFINMLGGSTFGVLMIHANSPTMLEWLWKTLLKTDRMYDSSYLPVHAIASVLLIFAVCSALDILRSVLIEKPFFLLWDKHYPKFLTNFKLAEDKLCGLLHIKK